MFKKRNLQPNLIVLFVVFITFFSIWHISISKTNILPSYQLIKFQPFNITNQVFSPNSIDSVYKYPTQILDTGDYGKIMNLTNFKFKIFKDCPSSPFLLILVHSSPTNFDKRKAIRNTWGKNTSKVRIIFLFGEVTRSDVRKKLEEENKKHKDIVQGSFVDTYRNISYKHVMGLKYVIYHCAQAKYVLKTDDDVFVNIPAVLEFLTSISPHGARKLLFCNTKVNVLVQRSYRSKWRVAFREFSQRYFPPYCPGWAILYSTDVVFNIYKSVQNMTYFWIDDVLITGIVAQKENFHITDSEPWILKDEYFEALKVDGASLSDTAVFFFGPPNMSVKDIQLLWKMSNNRTTNKYTLS